MRIFCRPLRQANKGQHDSPLTDRLARKLPQALRGFPAAAVLGTGYVTDPEDSVQSSGSSEGKKRDLLEIFMLLHFRLPVLLTLGLLLLSHFLFLFQSFLLEKRKETSAEWPI